MAVGISLSDTMYIVLANSGISQLGDHSSLALLLSVMGGVAMLGYGITGMVKPVAYRDQSADMPSVNPLRQVIKGFVLNGISPSVLMFWVGVSSLATLNYHYDGRRAAIFFATIVITVFTTDNLKGFLSRRLRNFFTPVRMKLLNFFVGLALVLFSFRLFYYISIHYPAISAK